MLAIERQARWTGASGVGATGSTTSNSGRLPPTPASLSNAGLTTASTAACPHFRENRFLHWMCIFMGAALLVSAYRPERVFDWWLENALVLSFLATLILFYNRLPLSDLSYLLIVLYLSFHEWGAHYKYSDVL